MEQSSTAQQALITAYFAFIVEIVARSPQCEKIIAGARRMAPDIADALLFSSAPDDFGDQVINTIDALAQAIAVEKAALR